VLTPEAERGLEDEQHSAATEQGKVLIDIKDARLVGQRYGYNLSAADNATQDQLDDMIQAKLSSYEVTVAMQKAMAAKMRRRAAQRAMSRLEKLLELLLPASVLGEQERGHAKRNASMLALTCLCLKLALVFPNGTPSDVALRDLAADPVNGGCEALHREAVKYCGGAQLLPSKLPRLWAMAPALLEVYPKHFYREHIERENRAGMNPMLWRIKQLRAAAAAMPTAALRAKAGEVLDAYGHQDYVQLGNVTENVQLMDAQQSEGTCVPPSFATPDAADPTHFVVRSNATLAGTLWSLPKLRMAVLVDIDNVVDHVMGPFSRSVLCLPPKLTVALTFMKQSNWFMKVFVPPFLEDDIIDTVNDTYAGELTFWHRFSRESLKATKRIMKQAVPIYFHMKNLCVSPGGKLNGWSTTIPQLDWLRDERHIRIRNFEMAKRMEKPRFIIAHRKLFLLPIIFASNNIGHVMFRYYSALSLIRKMGMENPIFGYPIVESALITFSQRHMHKVFYQALHGEWFNTFFGDNAAMLPPVFDLCFRNAVVGYDGIKMFHKMNPSTERRMVRPRQESQKLLEPALRQVRARTMKCLQLENPQDAYQPKQGPIRALWIVRRTRRIANFRELLAMYLLEAAQPGTPDRLVDPLSKREFTLEVVDLEFMTVRQQVYAISRADAVLGMMGAGQCNMMYMRPHGAVLEVQDVINSVRCTGKGVNQDRLLCDYSKQSVAARLNHIGFPVYKVLSGCWNALHCDVYMSYEQFRLAMFTTLCSVGKTASRAIQDCSIDPSIYGSTREVLSKSDVTLDSERLALSTEH
jgi:hypothetical protein